MREAALRPRRGRLVLTLREQPSGRRRAAATAVAIAVGLGLSALILIAMGVPPGDLLQSTVVGTLLNPDDLHSVLEQAGPLILVSVGACCAFRAGFWNLGLEGQMTLGGVAATAVSLFGIGPLALRLPVMAVCAMAAGIAWVWLAVWLKRRFAINEIISTLLMNYIAYDFMLHLLYGAWKDPTDSFPHSAPFAAAERLPAFGWGVSGGLVLALAAAALAWYALQTSRLGLYLRFVQANPAMARANGIPVDRVVLLAVLASAAYAGLGGFAVVSGIEGRLTESFQTGFGFSSILIAFLARSNPLGAVIAALLVAMLFVASQGLQVFYEVPISIVQLIQALVVMCIAGSEFAVRHRLRFVA
jgi:ABC-type uncharacterized transport system permease subunit